MESLSGLFLSFPHSIGWPGGIVEGPCVLGYSVWGVFRGERNGCLLKSVFFFLLFLSFLVCILTSVGYLMLGIDGLVDDLLTLLLNLEPDAYMSLFCEFRRGKKRALHAMTFHMSSQSILSFSSKDLFILKEEFQKEIGRDGDALGTGSLH